MGVTVSVVIPWRAGEPTREEAMRWLTHRLADLRNGWGLVLSETPEDEPWCKARAILQGVERATGDVIVVHDADVWCDGLPAAVAAVEAGYPWAVPHRRVHRLTPLATDRALDGDWPDERSPCLRRPYRGVAAGGILVAPRATLLDVPPDVRFTGWGSEDGAWRDALRCLAGREWRDTTAPLFHLHHEPQPRTPAGTTSAENAALAARYAYMRGDPVGMRDLMAEARVTA